MKNKIFTILKTMIFLTIIVFLLINITYLFRRADENKRHIFGIKSETEKLDMIYLGGSAAFVYWEPLNAWNEYGIASYVLGSHSVPAENILFYMRETMKYQKPDLFVIDLRPFEYYDIQDREDTYIGFRNGCDSFKIGKLRNEMIQYHMDNRSEPLINPIELYFDIIFYKNNRVALSNKENWENIDNKTERLTYRGFEFIYDYAPVLEPVFEKNGTKPISPEAEKMLKDLMNYCKENGLKVLFTVCPYQITTESQMKYNTLKKIIEDNDFDYINTNEYYEEMGIDFKTDFYNENHANIYGAEKYTKFLGNYIRDKYNLKNHKDDEKYKIWNDDYLLFKEEEQKVKEHILNKMKELEVAECEN